MEIKNFTMHYGAYAPLPCQAPCSMYSTLLSHGLIEDPFWRLNEQKYTALSDEDCTFESVFYADRETTEKEHIYLQFYGLDTLCRISLNGTVLGDTDNMYRTYSFDVRKQLICGENTLRLEFRSPTAYAREMNEKYFLWHNPDTLPGAAHLRKAICMFGWDWAPKLPDMGIFRKVELEAYDGDKIEDIAILQHHSDNAVELEIEVTTRHGSGGDIRFSIDGQCVVLKDGKGTVTVRDPRLWWVRGYGEQHLYEIAVELLQNGKPVDAVTRKIGLRTLDVSTEGEFCFVNNGVKIFAMGGNYVPQDSLVTRITPERTRKLLEACVECNHNCIRIWGGGHYPDDDFLDICDELGLVLWQDFMSACYGFWLHDAFKESYTQEAICNIKRLRLHACLGIFCGNNEMERNFVNSRELFNGEGQLESYIELFERILPKLCAELAPQVFYWPSSPSSGGGFHDVENEEIGDTHFYSPVADYENHMFRFCSEYGFEAFPPMKTIQSFSEPEDWNAFSRVMDFHQKSRGGNRIIVENLSDHYLMPFRFETFVYTSQLFQADEIDRAVQHLRRIRGTCMGSLYWQLNDTAPVASWAGIDYYGRFKALHYASRRFYAPVALGMFVDGTTLTVNLANETRAEFRGKLSVRLYRNDLTVLEETECAVCTAALSSLDVFTKTYEPEDRYSCCLVATLYDECGQKVFQKTALFVPPKHFAYRKPAITVDFEKTDAVTAKAAVRSDVFAGRVYLDFAGFDCVLSDNFFDIAANEPYEITFRSEKTVEELSAALTVLSVYDIGV